MSQRTVLSLVALALLVTAGIVWGTREDARPPPSYDLGDAAGDHSPAEAPAVPAEAPADDAAPGARGLPRILPPEAAVEDVRDALAVEDAAQRHEALREAYASLGRITRNDRVTAALRRLVDGEEDARVRGAVLAALGARRDGVHLAWLAHRLQAGRAAQDHLGALLAVAYDAKGEEIVIDSLGGLPVRVGALPDREDVRAGLRYMLEALAREDLVDARPVLVRAAQVPDDVSLAKAVEAWLEKDR